MRFRFDLVWRPKLRNDAEDGSFAEALATDAVMVISPALPEHPLWLKHLYHSGSLGPAPAGR